MLGILLFKLLKEKWVCLKEVELGIWWFMPRGKGVNLNKLGILLLKFLKEICHMGVLEGG